MRNMEYEVEAGNYEGIYLEIFGSEIVPSIV
jgi:hypothetical protein